MAFSPHPADQNKCSVMHQGTFVYGNPGYEVKVVIDGKDHVEYHNHGKYIIRSKIVWVSDCEYNTTMTKITIPDFPYGVGDVMHVKIDNINGNAIYYTATVKGQSWNGMFTKVDD